MYSTGNCIQHLVITYNQKESEKRIYIYIYIERERERERGFPKASEGEESACNAGDLGSIPGSRRSSGGENDYPLQYSCLENSMDRGAWQVTVHGIAKNWTRLSD